MRGMMQLVALMVILIIGVAIVLPVITEVGKEANLSEVPGGASLSFVIGLMPMFIGVAVILAVVGMFPFGDIFSGSSDDNDGNDDEEDEEVEEADPVKPEEVPVVHDKTRERLWSEELLKRRYVRGELTDEEYTDKMSRL